MSAEITSSTNPVVRAVVSGTAPQQARMAAARGLLPLAQEELLELLVALRMDADEGVASAADETLSAQEPSALSAAASAAETPPHVLAYLATRADLGRAAQEAVALNLSTPDDAIVELARATQEGAVLEVISINQQRLIRAPQIIDAVLSNPARPTRSAACARRAASSSRRSAARVRWRRSCARAA